MYQDNTNEFSFILKPSKHGVGAFAVHGIKKGTYLRLFGDEKKLEHRARKRKNKDVPEIFQQYCMNREGFSICPKDFGAMSVGWYLNHSKTPNAVHSDYRWYAMRDIEAGEEIVIDYNSLEEPEQAKEGYYK